MAACAEQSSSGLTGRLGSEGDPGLADALGRGVILLQALTNESEWSCRPAPSEGEHHLLSSKAAAHDTKWLRAVAVLLIEKVQGGFERFDRNPRVCGVS